MSNYLEFCKAYKQYLAELEASRDLNYDILDCRREFPRITVGSPIEGVHHTDYKLYFDLDIEDLKYLYNKYSLKAVEEILKKKAKLDLELENI